MINEKLFSREDGLCLPLVGGWAINKYKIIFDYMTLFSTGMKKNWDNRIFIDLYSSAGKAKVRDSDTILNTSALLSLNVPDPFDKYIFCEKDKKLFEALEKRVESEYTSH